MTKLTELNMCRGKACFSNTMAKKQEFLAAESFLFWNADDVKPIRDRLMMALSVPFQLLAAHRDDLSFQISFMKRCDTQEKRLQIPRPEWSAELECMIIACASIYDKCIDN